MIRVFQLPFYQFLNFLFVMLFSLVSGNVFADKFDELILNGVAPYSDVGVGFSICGLYLDSIKQSEEEVKKDKGYKRMLFNFADIEWSENDFAAQWRKSINDNNSAEAVALYASDIEAFLHIIQAPLVTNDKLYIDYMPNKGTVVSLNGFELKTFDKPDFFNILLNTWLGPVPPTTTFKKNILRFNTIPTNDLLRRRLTFLQPKSIYDERQKLIANWKDVKPKTVESASVVNLEIPKLDPKSPLGKYSILLNRETQRRSIYPDETLEINGVVTGKVVIKITLNNQGILQNQSIQLKDPFEPFNLAAIEAVKKSKYPPFPKEIDAKIKVFWITVKFVPKNDFNRKTMY